MPKRKKSREDKIDKYRRKLKRLEQRENPSDVVLPELHDVVSNEEFDAGTPALRPDDWLLDWPEDTETINSPVLISEPEPQPGPSTSQASQASQVAQPEQDVTIDLDSEVMEILGGDPSSDKDLGPEIRSELANRLLHIIKEGLDKDTRKNLIEKFKPPRNLAEINPPMLNPEIKAAIADSGIKRDKGIENKQREMSSAIAGLCEIINAQINATSGTRNNELLQKLMDVCRILCDLQHADSVTRRNFASFALKNNIREHLHDTKTDKFLFGENLSETLRTAKAVNKSSMEIKADQLKNNPIYKGQGPRPLNSRAPPQARRPPAGRAPPAPRSREPVVTRAPYHLAATAPRPPPPRARFSRTSSQPQQTTTYPRHRY